MRDVSTMTKKELLAVPSIPWGQDIICSSLIIIPGSGDKLHDSGYRCMGFIVVNEKNEPLGYIGGGSDVIHIGGISGGGIRTRNYTAFAELVPRISWSIDCLPKSGLLRLFARGKNSTTLCCAPPLSSFEVFLNDSKV